MPNAPKHYCTYPGCTVKLNRGQSRCVSHPYIETARPNSVARGYDAKWKLIRAEKIKLNPFCEDCAALGYKRAATEVHHMVKIAAGGTNHLQNLRSLCRSCHQKRTNRGE